jgi:hypothetical protein
LFCWREKHCQACSAWSVPRCCSYAAISLCYSISYCTLCLRQRSQPSGAVEFVQDAYNRIMQAESWISLWVTIYFFSISGTSVKLACSALSRSIYLSGTSLEDQWTSQSCEILINAKFVWNITSTAPLVRDKRPY